ncbi:DUF1499 domain-containing protein [Marinobacter caseinilyticus]|uniref:DUF1499 domain-containing protein n=1 Tax=Marinobacter caseinilyticus TaxID=2692195 RepID=UPI00140E5B45|nr:DUF1499 domain-containing protein [Marinobacter caseinilyticus]
MFAGKRPTIIGVRDRQLAACPSKPNCVSSQSETRRHHIKPLAYRGSPQQAMSRLKGIVNAQPGSQLIDETEGYLYFECRSKRLGFVDDLEFYCQPDRQCVQVRSASRLGFSDMGVNRKRVESIRRQFEGV